MIYKNIRKAGLFDLPFFITFKSPHILHNVVV